MAPSRDLAAPAGGLRGCLPFWTRSLVRTTVLVHPAALTLFERESEREAAVSSSRWPLSTIWPGAIGNEPCADASWLLPPVSRVRAIDQSVVPCGRDSGGRGPFALCRPLFLPLTARRASRATIVFMSANRLLPDPRADGRSRPSPWSRMLIAFNISTQLDWGPRPPPCPWWSLSATAVCCSLCSKAVFGS